MKNPSFYSKNRDLSMFSIFDFLVAIMIPVFFGTLHEYLHAWRAKHLGYNVKINLFRNYVDADVPKESPDFKKIANAPYVVILPLSLLIFILGIYFMQFGLVFGALTTLFLHVLSYPLEGKEVWRETG